MLDAEVADFSEHACWIYEWLDKTQFLFCQLWLLEIGMLVKIDKNFRKVNIGIRWHPLLHVLSLEDSFAADPP